MKISTGFKAVALCLLFGCVAQTTFAQALLTGRVSNAATRDNLEGARVEIQGQGQVTLTDSEGVYRFSGIAAGPVKLSVSFTGLQSEVVAVDVASDAPTHRDIKLTSAIYVLDKFVVAGEREGNAQAITLQRQSTGVKNVVSADAFGTLAGNPADLVMRLPGTFGESVGGDIRYVRIRGIANVLSTVTMDGNRVADAASAGATREFQFQQIGSDSIERIEVVKSPTPDMDADSIGGNVNMVSKSAFDRSPERRLSASTGIIWHVTDDRDSPHRNLSFSYTEVFKGKLGVSLNYANRAHNSLYDLTTQAHQNVVPDPAYTYSFTMTDNYNIRTRWGGGLRLDFKHSDNTRFYLNTTLNRHTEHNNIDTATFSTSQTIATRDSNGNLTGTGAIIPGFTKDVTEWRNVPASLATIAATSNNKYGESFHSELGAVHRYGDLKIDYDAYKSKSITDYPHNATMSFIANGVGMRVERTGEPFFPYVTQVSGPDITKLSSYTSNQYNIAIMHGVDKYWGAALNVKKDFRTPVPAYIKTGVRVRDQTRNLTNTPYRATYVGPDGVLGVNPATGVNDDNLAEIANPSVVESIHDGRYPRLPYPARPFRDAPGSARDHTGYSVSTALQQHPEYFKEDIAFTTMSALVGKQDFTERINSGYIMGDVELGRLSIMGGVRVEESKTWGEGAQSGITPEEKAWRAAYVGVVTDAELRRRTIAEYSGRRTASGKYKQVFPGLHFKYEPLRGLVTRASYATNIGRPAISQLIPRTTVDFDNRQISTSNPSLLPQYANNFDLSTEYYFEPVGLVSVSVFRKEIKHFIYTLGGQTVGAGLDNGFGGAYEGYTYASQRNGGYARVQGYELNYQQQLTFLPGWWSGLGVFANYTRLTTEGNYGTATVSSTGAVSDFIPEMANAGISYIRRRISIRFQFNHAGQYLSSFNANQALRLYKTARSVLDVKTVYKITHNFDVYLDVANVFNEADRAFVFYGDRPQAIQKHSPMFYCGINARL